MRELSEDYGAPRDYDASEPDRVPSRLGCMIGAALCGLSAMVTVAVIAWLFFTLTAHAHEAQPTAAMPSVDALWAKKREEA